MRTRALPSRKGPKVSGKTSFGPFLLGNARVRKAFLQHHPELLDPNYWDLHKQRILAGDMLDVFPYDSQRRFINQRQRSQPQPATESPFHAATAHAAARS